MSYRSPDIRLFPGWLYRAFYALHAAAIVLTVGLVACTLPASTVQPTRAMPLTTPQLSRTVSHAADDVAAPTKTLTPVRITTAPSTPTSTITAQLYTVKKGDTLGIIAKVHGVPLAALIEANGIKDPNLIAVGQALVIPQHSPSATALPPTSVAKPSATPRFAGMVRAKVVSITDGDTIRVEIQGTTYALRYIGIDCPETVHPSRDVEWMGPEACEANKNLVEGKTVFLEKDISETDKYGRLLRYVWVGNLMVNAELVRLGYAQASTYPPDVKYQEQFLKLQVEAREASRGLWRPAPSPGLTVLATSVPVVTLSSTEVPVLPSEGVVFITRTGEKYHRDGCRYLSKSKIPIRCSDAIARGYTACSVCRPRCE